MFINYMGLNVILYILALRNIETHLQVDRQWLLQNVQQATQLENTSEYIIIGREIVQEVNGGPSAQFHLVFACTNNSRLS